MTGGALIGARFALMIDLALLMGLPLFWSVMGMTGRKGTVALLACRAVERGSRRAASAAATPTMRLAVDMRAFPNRRENFPVRRRR